MDGELQQLSRCLQGIVKGCGEGLGFRDKEKDVRSTQRKRLVEKESRRQSGRSRPQLTGFHGEQCCGERPSAGMRHHTKDKKEMDQCMF